jgi:hypothetical protein
MMVGGFMFDPNNLRTSRLGRMEVPMTKAMRSVALVVQSTLQNGRFGECPMNKSAGRSFSV